MISLNSYDKLYDTSFDAHIKGTSNHVFWGSKGENITNVESKLAFKKIAEGKKVL